jgi:hypothetical protein
VNFAEHEFCDECPGCRPALVGTDGKVIPDDDPIMVAVLNVWRNQTTYQERKAFIEVTLHNSRLPSDLRLAEAVVNKIKPALEES